MGLEKTLESWGLVGDKEIEVTIKVVWSWIGGKWKRRGKSFEEVGWFDKKEHGPSLLAIFLHPWPSPIKAAEQNYNSNSQNKIYPKRKIKLQREYRDT